MMPVDEQAVLVTGSTDGLGRRVAAELAARGAEVHVHGRDPQKVAAAAREIGGGQGHVADFASLADVRRLASEIERLDVLVNNAGLISPERRDSGDGHELTFAVNYLSHFLLTTLLLSKLREPTRIVNVSSLGQAPIDFADVMLERGYEGFRAYAQSKLAQVMFSFELAERLGELEIFVNAVHPAALMDTKMVRETFGRARRSVDEGAQAVLRLACDPGLGGVTGRFFDGTRETAAHQQAYDREARRGLWELSERLTGARVTA
jgi:NAD(P)-dependent dehydrogenase (short-subunit alcohol dehydrogenase family)